ncbi:uncharacterized protein LOC125434922 isoform X2 [Sphaerodactylus townsendi]|uniref:uncharacterized protein LOC125434922 isoform X2 n=1 Tax=Sphaerodactylus townsendi TaxID=933632 RepID=UPI0020274AB9|nr:uncharacterized protein LOC125434922 isoform X2 [Sphaerodactylus townsendi]
MGPIHTDRITMDITHLLDHLGCSLEDLEVIRYHHNLVAPLQDIMDTTRSTSMENIMNMAAIMGIMGIMARSTRAVPVAVPTQTEGGFPYCQWLNLPT